MKLEKPEPRGKIFPLENFLTFFHACSGALLRPKSACARSHGTIDIIGQTVICICAGAGAARAGSRGVR
jgi:hypothetical protein